MSIEAMKQVIELYDKHCYNNDYGGIEFNRKHGYKFIEAIEALRTAIQQAESEPVGEPRARVELIKTGGNAGLSTRIIELDIATRERLRPGDLLYTHPAPGVPVGQAPSVWNSIQIASWIGSQLMREPSMFERNAVCKLVRSLGRHPTLLKHSPKDTHPAPSVPDDVVRDAERYRELVRSGKYCPASLGTHWALSTCSTRPSTKAELDAPIDAAMLAAQAQKGEPV